MNGPGEVRHGALPAVALALVAGVLGVQRAHGGGEFEPLRAADPCVAREVGSRAEGIEGLSERLVLLGLDGAACRLGVSREALTLDFAGSDRLSDRQVSALRAGLLGAVQRMKKDGSLPKASVLLDEALDSIDLPGLVKTAIRALPGSAVDGVLKTDDVLTRAIKKLDLRELLANLDDQGDLEKQIEVAVTAAVEDSLKDRVRNLV